MMLGSFLLLLYIKQTIAKTFIGVPILNIYNDKIKFKKIFNNNNLSKR